MSNNYSKYNVDDTLVCIKSTSPAYKEGKVYQVKMGEFGGSTVKGLVGDDKLFDPFSMLVSAFEKENIKDKVFRIIKGGKDE